MLISIAGIDPGKIGNRRAVSLDGHASLTRNNIILTGLSHAAYRCRRGPWDLLSLEELRPRSKFLKWQSTIGSSRRA